jgi:putative addiction module killer protein
MRKTKSPILEAVHNVAFDASLRIFFGPGYRVYFGEEAGNIVVILCGGDKNSQSRDIENAKVYWKEYKHREKT